MIDRENIPENTMFLIMNIQEDGDLGVMSGHHFADDLTEDEIAYYQDFFAGLNMIMGLGTDLLVQIGTMARLIHDYENEDEIAFEPDEELLDAIKDSKIIQFKDRLN